MKAKVKDMLSSYAIILLAVLTFYSVTGSALCFERYEYQIFFATALIFLAFEFTRKIAFKYRVLEVLLEFLTVSLVILTCGYFFRWYIFPNILDVSIIIVLVFFICSFLDLVNVSKDIRDIDKLIQKQKRMRRHNK